MSDMTPTDEVLRQLLEQNNKLLQQVLRQNAEARSASEELRQRIEDAQRPVDFNATTFQRDVEADRRSVAETGKQMECACRCYSCGNCISATLPCYTFWDRGCDPNCKYGVVECMAAWHAEHFPL